MQTNHNVVYALTPEEKILIAPCHCKGTQKYVHRSCLIIGGPQRRLCFCSLYRVQAMFVLRANVLLIAWWLRLKFQFLVARDHAGVFAMCFEQIVAFLGVLVYKFYGEELREMFGYEEHPYGFYAMAGILRLPTNSLLFILLYICIEHFSVSECSHTIFWFQSIRRI
ncbi:hypothetical protein SDJN02_20077 [Cucurbita argyrosperma subsp. argyrosperma]|nr:hypothetical protein SDJN02_20077 [Cucurbita argyrosperma subsp. argyrosperma]